MPPASLAHLSRQMAEKKWEEAKNWAYSRTTDPAYNVGCRPWKKPPGSMTSKDKEDHGVSVLPTEDGACACRSVSEMDWQYGRRYVLVALQTRSNSDP